MTSVRYEGSFNVTINRYKEKDCFSQGISWQILEEQVTEGYEGIFMYRN